MLNCNHMDIPDTLMFCVVMTVHNGKTMLLLSSLMGRVEWQLLWWGLTPIIYPVGEECSTTRGLVPGNKMREAKQTDILRLDEVCMRPLASIPQHIGWSPALLFDSFFMLVIFKSLVLLCSSNVAPLVYMD